MATKLKIADFLLEGAPHSKCDTHFWQISFIYMKQGAVVGFKSIR